MYYVQILPCLICRFLHVLCTDFCMSYVNCTPNGLAVRLAASVQRPCVYIHRDPKGPLKGWGPTGPFKGWGPNELLLGLSGNVFRIYWWLACTPEGGHPLCRTRTIWKVLHYTQHICILFAKACLIGAPPTQIIQPACLMCPGIYIYIYIYT